MIPTLDCSIRSQTLTHGPVDQLEDRYLGMVEARGSNPLWSTYKSLILVVIKNAITFLRIHLFLINDGLESLILMSPLYIFKIGRSY